MNTKTQTNKPIPTTLTIAPRGMSWHGDRLQKDNMGLLVKKVVNPSGNFSIDPSGKKSSTP